MKIRNILDACESRIALVSLPESNYPMSYLNTILEFAKKSKTNMPLAMQISTVDAATCQPSSRTVLLKDYRYDVTTGDIKFIFFTNYNSKKGLEISGNNKCSGVLYFDDMMIQFTFTGTVSKTSSDVSDAYWKTRSRGSRISSSLSRQSEVMDKAPSWSAVFNLKDAPPRPDHWGGYEININSIEVWTAGIFRMHTRRKFTKDTNGLWKKEFLHP